LVYPKKSAIKNATQYGNHMGKLDVATRPSKMSDTNCFQSMLFAPFLKREKSQKRRNSLFFLFSEGVEKCIPWNANLTQQIDLAFNIFFMVYFFIRVSLPNHRLTIEEGAESVIQPTPIHTVCVKDLTKLR